MRNTGPMDRWRRRRRLRRDQKKFKKFSDQTEKFDAEAQDTLRQVWNYTMVQPDMLFVLIESVRYVHRNSVPGAIVECGVWRGGAVMAAAMTFMQLGVGDRNFFLYDTFTGMTKPGVNDFSIDGSVDSREEFRRKQTGPNASDWCCAGLEEVECNLARTGYNLGRFVIVQGKVEDTIPATLPNEIGILRLDTDWYASTRHEMEHLFPRLVSKGVFIVDDYHTWAGSQRAVDEYLGTANITMLLTKVGGGVVGIKP